MKRSVLVLVIVLIILNLSGQVSLAGSLGCTPGYWKNHEGWPTDPGFSVLATLGTYPNPHPGLPSYLGDLTLGDAVRLKGGGEDAFLRHAVAAYLNSLEWGEALFGYDNGGVHARLLFAYNALNDPEGHNGDFEYYKNEFEYHNELGCPL